MISPAAGDRAAAIRAGLEADGFAFVGQVLAEPALPELGEAFDRAIAHGQASAYGLIVHDAWRRERRLEEELTQLARVAAQAMALREVVLFQDVLIAKPARAGDDVPWHQDYSYWPLDSARGVTMWVALDDAGLDNGCLHYVPGSHRDGERRASWGVYSADDPRAQLPLLDAAGLSDAIAAPAPAGSAWVHHPLTWHMSPSNRSRRRRRAWSLTWIAPDTRWAPDHAPHPSTAVERPAPGAALGDAWPRFRR